jgi:hypothetical protein
MQIEDEGFTAVHPNIYAQLSDDEVKDAMAEIVRKRILRDGLIEIAGTASLARAQRIAADLLAQIDGEVSP